MDRDRTRFFAGWHQPVWLAKSARALAGRLRRAQTFLCILGIEIVFGREGQLGTRTITITAMGEDRSHNAISNVGGVSDHEHSVGLNHPSYAADDTDANSRLCNGVGRLMRQEQVRTLACSE
jgi:hypothetical protein